MRITSSASYRSTLLVSILLRSADTLGPREVPMLSQLPVTGDLHKAHYDC